MTLSQLSSCRTIQIGLTGFKTAGQAGGHLFNAAISCIVEIPTDYSTTKVMKDQATSPETSLFLAVIHCLILVSVVAFIQ